MVLAGYGGASLLFFGVSPSAFGNGASSSIPSSPPTSLSAAIAREKTVEEANLTNAVDASEAETAGDGEFAGQGNENSVQEEYSWWDVLLGKHDQEIFERSTAHVDDSLNGQASSNEGYKSAMKATAVSPMSYALNYSLDAFFFKDYRTGAPYAPFLGPDRS
jgi:sn1-specific diacylglycerol lipase